MYMKGPKGAFSGQSPLLIKITKTRENNFKIPGCAAHFLLARASLNYSISIGDSKQAKRHGSMVPVHMILGV